MTSRPSIRFHFVQIPSCRFVFFCLTRCNFLHHVTLAQVPVDCCLSVATRPIEKRLVANYRHQVQGQGCAIDATIFLSRGGRTMCAPVNEKWVEDLKRHVDQLRTYCKKQNYVVPSRCFFGGDGA
uniref:C-C motif chemokine 19-like n=1 Tax=Neolamprologus brichardi TaxID=32507 RepID=A0A3Q4HKD6_NEOBR